MNDNDMRIDNLGIRMHRVNRRQPHIVSLYEYYNRKIIDQTRTILESEEYKNMIAQIVRIYDGSKHMWLSEICKNGIFDNIVLCKISALTNGSRILNITKQFLYSYPVISIFQICIDIGIQTGIILFKYAEENTFLSFKYTTKTWYIAQKSGYLIDTIRLNRNIILETVAFRASIGKIVQFIEDSKDIWYTAGMRYYKRTNIISEFEPGELNIRELRLPLTFLNGINSLHDDIIKNIHEFEYISYKTFMYVLYRLYGIQIMQNDNRFFNDRYKGRYIVLDLLLHAHNQNNLNDIINSICADEAEEFSSVQLKGGKYDGRIIHSVSQTFRNLNM